MTDLRSACWRRPTRRGCESGTGRAAPCGWPGTTDHPWARFTSPALTTVAVDFNAITERSFQILSGLIERGERTEERTETLFEGSLVLRASA